MNFQAGTSRLCYTYDKLVHYAFASEGRGPHRSPPAVSSMRKMFLAQHSQFLMRLIRDPEEVVRRLCPSNQVTPRILQKAAASGVTSSDAEWAGAVAETSAEPIRGSLAPSMQPPKRLPPASRSNWPAHPRSASQANQRAGLAPLGWRGRAGRGPQLRSWCDEHQVGGQVGGITVAPRELARLSGAEELSAGFSGVALDRLICDRTN